MCNIDQRLFLGIPVNQVDEATHRNCNIKESECIRIKIKYISDRKFPGTRNCIPFGSRSRDHPVAVIYPKDFVAKRCYLLRCKTITAADIDDALAPWQYSFNCLNLEPTLPDIRMGNLRGVA